MRQDVEQKLPPEPCKSMELKKETDEVLAVWPDMTWKVPGLTVDAYKLVVSGSAPHAPRAVAPPRKKQRTIGKMGNVDTIFSKTLSDGSTAAVNPSSKPCKEEGERVHCLILWHHHSKGKSQIMQMITGDLPSEGAKESGGGPRTCTVPYFPYPTASLFVGRSRAFWELALASPKVHTISNSCRPCPQPSPDS